MDLTEKAKAVLPWKLLHIIQRSVLTANYYAGRYKQATWIVGDGRSGTTWLADLINVRKTYREMFEPFHPVYLNEMRGVYWKYLRPHDTDQTFYRLARRVFSGRLQHPRVDAQNKRVVYNGLLIKDIFAHLFLKWVCLRFTHVKKILLMRHPFAVAVSKQKLKGWRWMANPSDFLDCSALCADYLYGFKDLIRETKGYFERQVLIWAVIHYVALNQLERNDVILVFYEELRASPGRELARILSCLHGSGVGLRVAEALDVVRRPSRTSRRGGTLSEGTSLADSWRRELSGVEIGRGLEILRAFNLDCVYGVDAMPDRVAAERLLNGRPGGMFKAEAGEHNA